MIDMIRECELFANRYVGNRQITMPRDHHTMQHEPSILQA